VPIKSAVLLLDHLFVEPSITVKDIATIAQLSAKAAGELAVKFVALGIVQPLDNRERNRLYVFSEYIAIFDDGHAKRSRARN